MIYTFSDRHPVPLLAQEVERLRDLYQDLDRIRVGDHPDERALATAPTLDGWSFAERPEIALIGKVHGNPTIADGRQARTSNLFFLAPELGYARTINRVYKLGRRHLLSDRRDFR